MINEYEIPHTEQGLKDFVRFGDLEIKRSELKIKKLQEMIGICKGKIAKLHEQLKNKENINGS